MAGEDPYYAGLYRAVEDVADLLADTNDFSIAALGVWDLRGLVGHFIRAIRTPLAYLAQPEPAAPSIPTGADYVVTYLDQRDADATAMDDLVAARGVEELGETDDHPSVVLRREVRRLAAVLRVTKSDRLVTTPFGTLRCRDYMRTRGLEITVHGLDIARAIDGTWTPPEVLLTDAIALLGEVATKRGAATDLVLALTGRHPPDPRDALPVLQ